MSKSIRSQIVALGEAEWRASRKTADWRHWKGCQLVNPLCPNDLCVLPANHVGTKEGYHILSTTPWDDPLKLSKRSILYFAKGKHSYEELIELGWRKQVELDLR